MISPRECLDGLEVRDRTLVGKVAGSNPGQGSAFRANREKAVMALTAKVFELGRWGMAC